MAFQICSSFRMQFELFWFGIIASNVNATVAWSGIRKFFYLISSSIISFWLCIVTYSVQRHSWSKSRFIHDIDLDFGRKMPKKPIKDWACLLQTLSVQIRLQLESPMKKHIKENPKWFTRNEHAIAYLSHSFSCHLWLKIIHTFAITYLWYFLIRLFVWTILEHFAVQLNGCKKCMRIVFAQKQHLKCFLSTSFAELESIPISE